MLTFSIWPCFNNLFTSASTAFCNWIGVSLPFCWTILASSFSLFLTWWFFTFSFLVNNFLNSLTHFFVSSQSSSSSLIEFTSDSPSITGSNLYRNVDNHSPPIIDLDPLLVTRILAFLMNWSPTCNWKNTYPSKVRCFPINSTYFLPFILSRTWKHEDSYRRSWINHGLKPVSIY